MIIGIPKETTNNENRVGITPAGVKEFINSGHTVLVEKGAGLGSGIKDEDYGQAGARIVDTAEEVYNKAGMIIKVTEPQDAECELLREGQVLYAFLHLAASPRLTKALVKRKVLAIAYETVQMPNGQLPLLAPMSEVAGRMAAHIGAHFLEKPYGGSGVLMGGVPGVQPAYVVVLGGGKVGTKTARIAAGMGAEVTIIEKYLERIGYLDDIFQGRVKILMSNAYNIENEVAKADLLIGAVLIPGSRAPRLVTEEMVKKMKPGSVIVDVAIDQGGTIATIDRVTSHSDPVYLKHGVLHYAVPNIAGAVARTSTFALTNATIPYAIEIANKGWKRAVLENPDLAKGLNVAEGKITYKAVADAHHLSYSPRNEYDMAKLSEGNE